MWNCRACGYRGALVVEDLSIKMRQLLRRIPKGKVTTYGALAKKLGTSPRAVGMMLKHNDPRAAPCYKVVRADGSLGGYSGPGGLTTKIRSLRADHIEVKSSRIDLARTLYKFD
jgi:methylated-DNA-[protein]-cysteine S-methyltransferase